MLHVFSTNRVKLAARKLKATNNLGQREQNRRPSKIQTHQIQKCTPVVVRPGRLGEQALSTDHVFWISGVLIREAVSTSVSVYVLVTG